MADVQVGGSAGGSAPSGTAGGGPTGGGSANSNAGPPPPAGTGSDPGAPSTFNPPNYSDKLGYKKPTTTKAVDAHF